MDYTLTIAQIIKEQEKIIGPLAVELARGVGGLELIDLESKTFTFARDGKLVVHDLVKTYSQFFGKASVEICREIIKETYPSVTSDDMSAMTSDTID